MAEEKQGYVYILTNPSFREDWVKIGKSSRPVDKRLKELDNTSVPLPFEPYATLKTAKYSEAEKLVHHYIERFTNLRIRDNREFFNVKPEVALEIFREISVLLDDAEIDEIHKKAMTGSGEDSDSPSKSTPPRKEKKKWLIPFNVKFFDLHKCFEKYGEVYWTQKFNFQAGDTGYIYSSAPDSAVKYSFEVIAHDLPYDPIMDKDIEFHTDPADFEEAKKHNRFALIRKTGYTNDAKFSLANLLDNGMKMAPRGALNLSWSGLEELCKYIEENF